MAIDVEHKKHHVKNLHHATIKSFLAITGALGVDHPDKLAPQHIYRRINNVSVKAYNEIYHYLQPGELLTDNIHPDYAPDWAEANAEKF